jgi:hypothetical protein
MKLELIVSKKFVSRRSGSEQEIVFSVVDFDRADQYPLNFVCLLPRHLDKGKNASNRFPQIYGEKGKQIAVELLTAALDRETDVDVRNEIEKRLRALQPKQQTKAACVVCGRVFEPKKTGYHFQRICPSCIRK